MNTKLIFSASIIIAWAFVVALIITGLIFFPEGKLASQEKKQESLIVKEAATAGSITKTLDLSEVAKHSTEKDCWLIIRGNVYDATNYISQHPGGTATITRNCGKDSTEEFSTRGGTGKHSTFANNLLEKYIIGKLGSELNETGTSTSTINNTATAPIAATQKLILNMAELSKHNTQKDCWLLISGKIYDATNYMEIHPGGAATITRNCGKDSTEEFSTRGGTGKHSTFAISSLNNYYIGDLNQEVPTTSLGTKPTASLTPYDEDEDKDEEDEEEDERDDD